LITCIDALSRERCASSGSRDRTARLWKIPEESQLVFRSGGGISISDDLVVLDELKKKKEAEVYAGGSIDVVAMIDDDHFLTGSDSGYVYINA
jgi:ribosomal RNA-processing protein 9